MFDEKYPQLISVGNNVKITEGVRILTHFYDTRCAEHSFYQGPVDIEDDVFLGTGTVIAAPVIIGRGAIIGANSVVLEDVPPCAIMGGIPAKRVGTRGNLAPVNLSAVHRT